MSPGWAEPNAGTPSVADSRRRAPAGSMLPLINHQRLLIKVISQPEIELLITAVTPVNQRFKGAYGWTRGGC